MLELVVSVKNQMTIIEKNKHWRSIERQETKQFCNRTKENSLLKTEPQPLTSCTLCVVNLFGRGYDKSH